MRCAHEHTKEIMQRYEFDGVEIDGKPVKLTFPLPTCVCARCGMTLWRGSTTLRNMIPVADAPKAPERSEAS